MNIRMSTVVAKIIGIFLVTIALNGCYSYSSMTKSPEKCDNLIVSTTGSSSDKIGYVSNINVKLNSGYANTNDGFVKRVMTKLQQSNYFKDVSYGLYTKKPESSYIDLNFNIDEIHDMNMGGNLTKAFFTGFTLFVLAPALPNTYDFYTDHYMQATWPNGTKREYRASCAGSASGTFPYIGLVQEYNKITGDATEKCMTSVINQFVADNVK
ncbi:hypothetical protein [Geobacter sp. DSM 9736]|uniref:hypothetical protein n=1 Tax=Geobacter sp. DSM 9736 TaxID=1277350 RepID=UPI000B508B00|nr:hypothetical protein [Geobacter sp. DSM 9736]SNB46293.1 hypothetical protein SAMN06269301_1741 [Geobacter sp. DSM 9736]